MTRNLDSDPYDPWFEQMVDRDPEVKPEVRRQLAADLMELHEGTGISLDNWVSAREFVEAYFGPIQENHA